MMLHKRIAAALIVGGILTDVAASASAVPASQLPAPAKLAAGASPIYGVTLPVGYRQWELVSVSYEAPFDEFRGILANPTAMAAYREGNLPFPDGSVLVKLAWKRVPSTEFEGAFIPGAATTVQVMLKDSTRFTDSGGWGFGRFIKGVPADETQHRTCFACHQARVQEHDFVFTRLAP
jgi:hypothetical protein